MVRPIAAVGVLLVVVGAVLLAGPLYGFTTLAADRGVSVSTADGADAYLGLVGTDAAIDDPDDEAEIATLTNNVGSELALAVDVTFTDGADDDLEAETPQTVAPGETVAVTVACDGQGGAPNQATTATVTVTEATGDGVTITDVSADSSLEYTCNRGGGGGTGQPGNPGGGPP